MSVKSAARVRIRPRLFGLPLAATQAAPKAPSDAAEGLRRHRNISASNTGLSGVIFRFGNAPGTVAERRFPPPGVRRALDEFAACAHKTYLPEFQAIYLIFAAMLVICKCIDFAAIFNFSVNIGIIIHAFEVARIVACIDMQRIPIQTLIAALVGCGVQTNALTVLADRAPKFFCAVYLLLAAMLDIRICIRFAAV